MSFPPAYRLVASFVPSRLILRAFIRFPATADALPHDKGTTKWQISPQIDPSFRKQSYKNAPRTALKSPQSYLSVSREEGRNL